VLALNEFQKVNCELLRKKTIVSSEGMMNTAGNISKESKYDSTVEGSSCCDKWPPKDRNEESTTNVRAKNTEQIINKA